MNDEKLYLPFTLSIWNTLSSMSSMLFSPEGNFYTNQGDLNSFGATVVVGFSGKIKGRFLIDLEGKLAIELAAKLNGENYNSIKDPMVIATLSEIGNITAGDAITAINNEFSYGLRLVPPVVFLGDNMVVGLQNMESYTMDFKNGCGKLKINVAFEKGLTK